MCSCGETCLDAKTLAHSTSKTLPLFYFSLGCVARCCLTHCMFSLEVLVTCFLFPLLPALIILHIHTWAVFFFKISYTCLCLEVKHPCLVPRALSLYSSCWHLKGVWILHAVLTTFIQLGCELSLGLPLMLESLLSTDPAVGKRVLKSNQVLTAFSFWPPPPKVQVPTAKEHLQQLPHVPEGPGASLLCLEPGLIRASLQGNCPG